MESRMNVIDLFAGVGGLSLGFERAGFNVVLANEIDPEIADAYRHNHKETVMINDDIMHFIDCFDEVLEAETPAAKLVQLREQLQNIDVIIGGPPCQGFSMAGGRIRKKNEFIEDPRNFLFKYYFKFIQRFEPKYFVFENVEGLLSLKSGAILEMIKEIFSDETNFRNGGYYLKIKVFNAYDYGVPQIRKRVIIIGSKMDFDYDQLLEETIDSLPNELRTKILTKHTVSDAIRDLLNVPYTPNLFIKNHVPTRHNQIAVERMSKVKPSENWKVLEEEIHSVHSGSYGRLSWDAPATTITTRFDTPSAGRYIHPSLNRTLTPREAARIQTFPDDFEFIGSKSSICKQIGNAVPPLLAELIAHLIITLHNKNHAK